MDRLNFSSTAVSGSKKSCGTHGWQLLKRQAPQPSTACGFLRHIQILHSCRDSYGNKALTQKKNPTGLSIFPDVHLPKSELHGSAINIVCVCVCSFLLHVA